MTPSWLWFILVKQRHVNAVKCFVNSLFIALSLVSSYSTITKNNKTGKMTLSFL